MRVAYILSRFPTLTTTFIYREVEAVRRLGVEVETFSVWKPRYELLSDESLPLVQTTTYLLPPRLPSFLAAHVRFAFGRPGRYWTMLARLLLGRHQSWSTRLRALSHFVQAVPVTRAIEKKRVDRVHAHFSDKPATIAMVASRLLDVPFSFSGHAGDLHIEPVLLAEKMESCDFATVVCRANVGALNPRGDQRLASRIHVVHAGVVLAELDPARRDPSPTPLVLGVGRLVEKKGFLELIRAVALLRGAGIELGCRIVGEGPMREALEELIGESDLADVVELAGSLRHEEVRDQLRSATLFVLPCVVAENSDRDGIPVALMEAMAMTVPVVSTPVAGIAELIRDGENGRLVPSGDAAALADAMKSLLADRALSERLGAAGRETVRADFDARESARQMARLFGVRSSAGGDRTAR